MQRAMSSVTINKAKLCAEILCTFLNTCIDSLECFER